MRIARQVWLCWLLLACSERLDFYHSGRSIGQAGAPGHDSPEPQPLGSELRYHLTLEETCDGVQPDPRSFITFMRAAGQEFRTWGQRQEYMADENVFTDQGDCVIRAEQRATGGAPYTSGTLNTAENFEQLYGFFEARLKPPAGVGLWTVFWLRSTGGWPPAIDIFDYLDQAPAPAQFSYWWAGPMGTESDVQAWADSNLHEGYHVYGCEWRAGYLAFYFDGVKAYELVPPRAEIAVPLYPAFNLSIPAAGEGRRPPDATTIWPSELRIDWLRVYAQD